MLILDDCQGFNVHTVARAGMSGNEIRNVKTNRLKCKQNSEKEEWECEEEEDAQLSASKWQVQRQA